MRQKPPPSRESSTERETSHSNRSSFAGPAILQQFVRCRHVRTSPEQFGSGPVPRRGLTDLLQLALNSPQLLGARRSVGARNSKSKYKYSAPCLMEDVAEVEPVDPNPPPVSPLGSRDGRGGGKGTLRRKLTCARKTGGVSRFLDDNSPVVKQYALMILCTCRTDSVYKLG